MPLQQRPYVKNLAQKVRNTVRPWDRIDGESAHPLSGGPSSHPTTDWVVGVGLLTALVAYCFCA